MSTFYIEEYQPFKTYSSLVKYVLQAITDINSITDGHTILSLVDVITTQMHQSDLSGDVAIQKQYYEYQELVLAMECFLDYYLAITPFGEEPLSSLIMIHQNLSAAKCRNHCRNFLITRKIE